ncbi:MAG TPA: type II/IV secretion system protein [Candidatus Parcubacteria bacterium]|nr:type II/IV secretion system protein [Candidatus Parcubacteria bacterium]
MEREKIRGQISVSRQEYSLFKSEIKSILDYKEHIKALLNSSTTKLLAVVLAGALILDSSDIHLEPEEENAKLRIRIDGVLHDVVLLNLNIYKALLNRIKLLSNLKLNIKDRPQDGRFTILLPKTQKEPETEIEVRASSLPSGYGESLVLRLLNPKNLIEIEALGLREDLLETFKKEIKKPNGMIVVTGPTGSGKTTTLYAILKKINKPEIKIITIEDPIEYRLEGLSQTQVNPKKGYTFASGLRSIMRQDPDVILVGEIRDLETAEIACQAALTGHLVFSTLHTNDAAGAVARLIDIGVRPVSIAPALNMVVAQRLPRKVCQKCVKFVEPSKKDLKKIKHNLSGLKKEILPKNFLKGTFKIPLAQGCKNCNFTGYRGRIGIFETFLVDDEMERFILKSPSIVAMRKMAIKKGMVLMRQDGLIKVLEGITTIEEIERVAELKE